MQINGAVLFPWVPESFIFSACDEIPQCRPQAEKSSAQGRSNKPLDRDRKPRMKSLWHPRYSLVVFWGKWDWISEMIQLRMKTLHYPVSRLLSSGLPCYGGKQYDVCLQIIHFIHFLKNLKTTPNPAFSTLRPNDGFLSPPQIIFIHLKHSKNHPKKFSNIYCKIDSSPFESFLIE